jgi:hypothetical protein
MNPKNPRSEVVSGEFYYGAPCRSCGTFQYVIYDEDRGVGSPATITGNLIRWRCDFCGHDATYLPGAMRRRQAP